MIVSAYDVGSLGSNDLPYPMSYEEVVSVGSCDTNRVTRVCDLRVEWRQDKYALKILYRNVLCHIVYNKKITSLFILKTHTAF